MVAAGDVGLSAYAELSCQTAFSLLEGASMPEELAERARALGLAALGVCDRDNVYGLVRAWKTGKDAGLEVLHGATLTLAIPEDRAPPIAASAKRGTPVDPQPRTCVVYARDVQGWATLCELLTRGRAEQPKGSALLELRHLLAHNEGLIGLVDGSWPAEPLAEALGDRLYVTVQRRLLPSDAAKVQASLAFAWRVNRPLVAVNGALMHAPERQRLQDVLTCIRHGITLEKAGRLLQPNAERHLKGAAEMSRLFADLPGVVGRSVEVAERCRFRLDELRYQYPKELVPPGSTPMAHLRQLVSEGARWRWPRGPSPTMRSQIEHELRVIEELDFPSYFLTVYDIVRFARERRILCQGRGSAANSVVCFVLGITAVDPGRQRLLFERFISKERAEPPDIDVDFEHERREEVIQYIYEKYGRHRAAMVNEIISYQPRSAIRDVGKALGLSLDQVDRMAKNLDWWHAGLSPERVAEAGVDMRDPRVARTLEMAKQIQRFPRHLSIHVGGFVISEEALRERCPIEPAAMENRTVIQWDKDDVDAVNFVKVDVLSLGMLTAIRKCFDLVQLHHGRELELATVPAEDPAVYDMLGQADSVGVFQIESRAQMSMLPRLRPRSFYDLVVEVAIVRPGPIQGGMVHPYLDRRSGAVPIVYAHPALEPILERTLGVPIFQEQVMEMAMAVGGFSGGEADQLRRAMGAWRKRGGLQTLVDRLMRNMQEQGLPPEYTDQIAKQILGFGEYGFPESHAASFALLVYVSSYLKRYYPAAFAASLLNAQPMGFYGPRSLVDDARRHGVEARPVDVRVSDWDNTLEPDGRADPLRGGRDGQTAGGVAIRLGLRQISGFGEEAGRRIEQARKEAPFLDLPDLARRAQLDRGDLRALARADALRGLASSRREAAWVAEGLWTDPLFAGMASRDQAAPLPVASPMEELQQDYLSTGLSLDKHPIGLARKALDKRRVLRIADLMDQDNGDLVRVAGLVIVRQRPGTASGVVFMTVEDETGLLNLVIWPKLYERQRRIIRHERLLLVAGRLQREGDAHSLLATGFEALNLGEIATKSRDFH